MALRQGVADPVGLADASKAPRFRVRGQRAANWSGWPTGTTERPWRETVRGGGGPGCAVRTISKSFRILCRPLGQKRGSLTIGGLALVARRPGPPRERRCKNFGILPGFFRHPPPVVGSSIIGGHRNALVGPGIRRGSVVSRISEPSPDFATQLRLGTKA